MKTNIKSKHGRQHIRKQRARHINKRINFSCYTKRCFDYLNHPHTEWDEKMQEHWFKDGVYIRRYFTPGRFSKNSLMKNDYDPVWDKHNPSEIKRMDKANLSYEEFMNDSYLDEYDESFSWLKDNPINDMINSFSGDIEESSEDWTGLWEDPSWYDDFYEYDYGDEW